MARLETSAESPVPVRVVALRIGEWIARLGEIWVDGQVAQLNRRPGVATQFLTLRDPNANVSMTVTCGRGVLPDSVVEGSRVVLRARPDFYLERGTLSLRATEVRQVGLGELLARLEALRRLLAAEGLFAAELKRPLPFLPRTVGLITGRASAAERDVVENARRRLPGARFAGAVVPVDAAARGRWLAGALLRLADADLVFFDPDNGLEVPSVPAGRRGSDKYLYWDEVERAWAAGHSLLVYQHFPRVARPAYNARLLAALRERTGAPVTGSFTTSHVVFLLAARREHAPALRAGAAAVARSWQGEIEVRLDS